MLHWATEDYCCKDMRACFAALMRLRAYMHSYLYALASICIKPKLYNYSLLLACLFEVAGLIALLLLGMSYKTNAAA